MVSVTLLHEDNEVDRNCMAKVLGGALFTGYISGMA